MHEVGHADPGAALRSQVLSRQGFVTGLHGVVSRQGMREGVNALVTLWMSLLQSCGVEARIRRSGLAASSLVVTTVGGRSHHDPRLCTGLAPVVRPHVAALVASEVVDTVPIARGLE